MTNIYTYEYLKSVLLSGFSLLKSFLLYGIKSTFVFKNREQAPSSIPTLFHLKMRALAHMVLPVITGRLPKSIGQILMTRQDPVNAPGCGLE